MVRSTFLFLGLISSVLATPIRVFVDSHAAGNVQVSPLAVKADVPAHGDGGFVYTADETRGPGHWTPEICQTGKAQSPIALQPAHLRPTPFLPTYPLIRTPLNMTLDPMNLRVDIPEEYKNATGFRNKADGDWYALQQFHFHTPSEHWIGREFMPMEMHMVHVNSQGQRAVLSFMFDYDGMAGSTATAGSGQGSAFLHQLTSFLPTESHTTTMVPFLSFDALLPLLIPRPPAQAPDMFTYAGSLTTPPCTENVSWHVVPTPLGVATGDVKRIGGLVGFNARPIRELNGRGSLADGI
ncbi:alpha carbonic anhydrase [Phlyctochytrium arcticum]|nr:alpha carbonic anhydrase [Phlyctochytrium arcticum]